MIASRRASEKTQSSMATGMGRVSAARSSAHHVSTTLLLFMMLIMKLADELSLEVFFLGCLEKITLGIEKIKKIIWPYLFNLNVLTSISCVQTDNCQIIIF